MAKQPRVPGTHIPSYLGTEIPPRGWLLLNEGKEITCSDGKYYLDPEHKRKGYHLVAMNGELFEVEKIETVTKEKTKGASRFDLDTNYAEFSRVHGFDIRKS